MAKVKLPGFNCGLCGFRSCDEFAEKLEHQPDMLKRCIHMDNHCLSSSNESEKAEADNQCSGSCAGCGAAAVGSSPIDNQPGATPIPRVSIPKAGFGGEVTKPWKDSLGRDFDFYLEKFPEDVGPREIIIPHNPMITREMDIQVGDILIGRPLGMSCGCPITHCGVAVNVDKRTGVIIWCVTGPLDPRKKGFKDLGYYIAEGYEGIVRQSKCDIKIGMRYFFQPHLCMLQWRHSGLVNYLNKTQDGLQIRIEGLWIG